MSGDRKKCNHAIHKIRWPFVYKMMGQIVRPPKEWQRGAKWLRPSDCVKTCKVCQLPLWRHLYECPSEWETRRVHAGECQHVYTSQLAAKMRDSKLKKQEKAERPIEKDREQQKINESCGNAYVLRMWLTPDHPIAQHYLRGALI